MKDLCIIIPVHRNELNVYEKISLEQLATVVSDKYDTFIVTHDELDIIPYLEFVPYAKKETFDKDYFTSFANYNKLCMSECFYERFSQYEYMMIYQTDACIFRDNMQEFIKLGYNWYGAPIQTEPYLYNGGFNIRKIARCREICSVTKSEIDFYGSYEHEINEDVVFSTVIGNLPPRDVAILFSWEHFLSINQIKEYIALTENKGPMGCHYFKREHFPFLKPYLKKEILEKYESLI